MFACTAGPIAILSLICTAPALFALIHANNLFLACFVPLLGSSYAVDDFPQSQAPPRLLPRSGSAHPPINRSTSAIMMAIYSMFPLSAPSRYGDSLSTIVQETYRESRGRFGSLIRHVPLGTSRIPQLLSPNSTKLNRSLWCVSILPERTTLRSCPASGVDSVVSLCRHFSRSLKIGWFFIK